MKRLLISLSLLAIIAAAVVYDVRSNSKGQSFTMNKQNQSSIPVHLADTKSLTNDMAANNEVLISNSNADDEYDKGITLISLYSKQENGNSTEVVSGFFRVFDKEGSGKIVGGLQDGVITVKTQQNGQRNYQVYHSPVQHGALRITSVTGGKLLHLVAMDGERYDFDLITRSFGSPSEPLLDIYDNFMNAFKIHQQDIGGSSDVHYDYPKNSPNAVYKKPEQLSGYVTDEELDHKAGHYIRKVMITYKQYVNLGLEEGLRHDIDPERKVWVLTSRFDGEHEVNDGQLIDGGSVTATYDAETGDMLSVGVDANSGAKVLNNICECKPPNLKND